MARAADRGEALDVFLQIGVEDLAEDAALMFGCREAAGVVRGGFVAEAPAVARDLHERLASEVELLVGADELGARARFRDDARILAGQYRAAVEDHRDADRVFLAADPHAGLDAVSDIVRGADLQGDAAIDHRVAGAQHLGIAGVAAGGEQDALLCVHLHVGAAGFEDRTGHAAALVLDELDEAVLVGDVVTLLVDIGEQDLIALEPIAIGVLAGIVVLHRRDIVAGAAGLMIYIGIEFAGHASCG